MRDHLRIAAGEIRQRKLGIDPVFTKALQHRKEPGSSAPLAAVWQRGGRAHNEIIVQH